MKHIECHLFSGLLDAGAKKGTRKLEKIIDKLPLSINAHHHLHNRWEWVKDGILARAKDAKPAKIILIGHSYGAKRCQQIAVELRANKLDVDYIAGIDPTALFAWQKPMKIPKNVSKIDEFYAFSGPPFSARAFDPSGKSGGKFIIPNSIKENHSIFQIQEKHIKCASSKIARKRIIEQIAKIIKN